MPVGTVFEALTNCRMTPTWAVGMCGQFCARMYGYQASGYRDAVAQWRAVPDDLKHAASTEAPAGALLFWGGGSAGHGHVAIADGTGQVWSIDISGPGTVSRVPAGTINLRWGLPYLGWTAPYFQGMEWSPAMIYGADVSAYQAAQFPLTTPSDNKRVDFAFIKITEGMAAPGHAGYNSRWVQQRQWARDHGLVVGFYHFARPGSMVDQAEHFLAQVALAPGDVIAFDWEDQGVSCAQKDAWISYVQKRAPGHRVVLYCNTYFWKSLDTTSFAGDGLWIATGGIPAGQPPIQSNWLIHQYSTAGNLDHNVAQFATRADMITWAEGTEDMALSPDDKTWVAAEIRKAIKELVYGQVWDQDQMVPPAGQATPDNLKWKAQSLLRFAGEQAANALAQARANGAGLTEIKTILASLDLSHVPEEVAAKIEQLKLIVTVQEGA